MAFAHTQNQQDSIAQINITPLVDVMLVLLVIFMIAAPVLTRTIPLQLNGDPPPINHTPPKPIELRIDASGEVFFNGNPAPVFALQSLFSAEAVRAGSELPAVKIDVNGEADYEVVAKAMAASRNAGLDKIGFVRIDGR